MSTKSLSSPSDTLQTWPLVWKMIRFKPHTFGIHSIFVAAVFGLQIFPGLIVRQIFDTISGASAPRQATILGVNYLWWLVGLYLLVELARLLLSIGSEWYGTTFHRALSALLSRNLLASILRRPGDKPLPVSSGEALNRFDEDVQEVADFPLWLPDQLGKWIAAGVAIVIMASINLPITLVIFIPLLGMVILTRLAWSRVIYYRKASGKANDIVSGFLAEAFSAVQAIKVANAEESITAQIQQLNEQRAEMDVRHWTYRELLHALNSSMVTFGIGLMLLLSGQAIAGGTFTIGDFALFVSYLWFTTAVPSEIGTFYGDYQTQAVSIERMLELVRPDPPESLAEHHPVYEHGAIPPVSYPLKTNADRLETLEVRGLTYRHNGINNPGADQPDENEDPRIRGIEGIDFTLRRGELLVITGRVGSGKSTLARVLIGMLPRDGGEILWNGKPVSDFAGTFRPPRCAYLPQVPRLFSDSLRENILMGYTADGSVVDEAIHLSVLEDDIQALENGLDTLVGPRGVRLSGGQVQRTAAARMFIRQPELLVFDDLSSALDVETEQELWQRIDERRTSPSGDHALTCLVVSHRRPAFMRADRILILMHGRVEAQGTLAELLNSNREMQQLWQGSNDPSTAVPIEYN
jgi:ATP-binding cassette subfamily B protein